MRRNRYSLLLAAAALLATACHDSSGSGATAFDPLVTNLIQNRTDETSAPIQVNGRTFVFPDDPNAFADVLPPDGGPVVE